MLTVQKGHTVKVGVNLNNASHDANGNLLPLTVQCWIKIRYKQPGLENEYGIEESAIQPGVPATEGGGFRYYLPLQTAVLPPGKNVIEFDVDTAQLSVGDKSITAVATINQDTPLGVQIHQGDPLLAEDVFSIVVV